MPTVSRLNLWTLWWNSERLLHGYRGYWQAPIFAGGRLLVVDRRQPGRAYDAVLPMAFASNGWCGYFLLRRLHVRFLQGN